MNSRENAARQRFNSNSRSTASRRCFSRTDPSRAEIARLRDECIIRSAEILMPICVRRKGSLEESVEPIRSFRFRCFLLPVSISESAREQNSYELDIRDIPEELHQGTHIIHWTRTSNTAWPGERKIDYYRAILGSDTYPRTAFHTLQNILATRTVRSSSNHIPRKTAVVSFSGCPPAQFIPLMKWRSRYRQMSFEPYGIGFERGWALSHGIRPVRYLDAKSKDQRTRRTVALSIGRSERELEAGE